MGITGDHQTSVLVLEGHAPTRLGYALLLEREDWVVRCLLAADEGEAVALAERHRPGVAVIDTSERGPFVVGTSAAVRAVSPETRIVLASRCRPVAPSVARQAGALGSLRSDGSASELRAAVRLAAGRAGPLPPPPATASASALTPRERDILRLMASGATNREIAAELHLGSETVKKAASRLYRRLGVRNRTEAVRRAAETRA